MAPDRCSSRLPSWASYLRRHMNWELIFIPPDPKKNIIGQWQGDSVTNAVHACHSMSGGACVQRPSHKRRTSFVRSAQMVQ